MLNYVFVLLVLIYASYTDFTKREIPNFLILISLVFGIIYNISISVINSNYLIFVEAFVVGIVTFIVCYLLWRIGAFAGGDAKLLSVIAFIIPYHNLSLGFVSNNVFVFSLFVLSLFVLFPYGALLGVISIIKKKMYSYFYKNVLSKSLSIIESVAVIVSVYLALSFFGITRWAVIPVALIIGFVPRKIKIPFLIVSFPLAMYVNFWQNLQIVISLVLISYVVWFVVKLFILTKSGLLNYNKNVSGLEEGDLLAYAYTKENNKVEPLKFNFISELWYSIKKKDKAEIKDVLRKRKSLNDKVFIDNRFARGLNSEEIGKLKKYLSGEVELKRTIPLVPAMLIAYVLMYVVGDILWMIL